jgi:hypothetical protein
MKDPASGWLVRKDGIRAGVDNVRVEPIAGVLTLGELMSKFLAHKQGMTKAGELSKTTLAGYLREVRWLVEFMKPSTPVIFLGADQSHRRVSHGQPAGNGMRHWHWTNRLAYLPCSGITAYLKMAEPSDTHRP